MVTDDIASAEAIWLSIRSEAEAVAVSDPVLRGSLSLAILDHPGLGSAVAFQIGQRLGTGSTDRAQFARVANEAFSASPDLVETASRDLQGIVRHDPASRRLLPPLLTFKGYVALQAWRVANWLWREGRTDLALLLQSASSEQLQVSIHPSASIGMSVFLDHATGLIVGSSVSIGDEVTIYQDVTIGRKEADPGPAPRIGRGVLPQLRSDHSRGPQHWRLRQDRGGIGGNPRRAGRMYRRRRARAADELSGGGGSRPEPCPEEGPSRGSAAISRSQIPLW